MRILYLPSYKAQQRQFEKKNYNPYPVRLASEAEWYRKQGHEVVWAAHKELIRFVNGNADWRIILEPENLPFLSLPHPDRVFTRAKEYTSGNYKYLPGTHIMSASGCWHGKCTFCVENGKPYEARPVEDVISEIEECKALGFREIFDDSATFPTGRWLDEFCGKFYNLGIKFGCNMRIVDIDYRMLYKSNFRMVLFGVESASQITLDKINKGVKVEDIIPTIKKAAEAGLEPHIAVMFGYPWETDKDAARTLALVHYLLRKGYAKTAQASFYNVKATPGTERANEAQRKYVKKIYHAGYHLDFWWVRRNEDISYLWKGILAWCQSVITRQH